MFNSDCRAESAASIWPPAEHEGGSAGALAGPIAHVAVDTRPTVLLVGDGRTTTALAGWAERAGLRCVGRITPEAAAERLGRTVALDLILLDARGMDIRRRLGWTGAQVLAGHHGLPGARLAVIADLAGLDCALAMLDGPGTDFLCEPAASEIVTLLVMAALHQTPAPALPLHDAARDGDVARLERLSDEVRRLAATIERMTLGETPLTMAGGMVLDRRGGYRGEQGVADPTDRFQPRTRQRPAVPATEDGPSATEIRRFIRARRMRDQYLPADLFADPAWDMILDLLAARLAGQHVSVSSLCIAAAVPPTTALRWIRQLTDRAIFARIDDPADGRRVFIELTDTAAEAALGWVQAVRHNGGLLAERR